MIRSKATCQRVLEEALNRISPLSGCVREVSPFVGQRLRPNAIVDLAWSESREAFVVEVKNETGRVRTAAEQARRYSAASGLKPLVVVPSLSESDLANLEELSVNGLDMAGNATISFGQVLYRVSGRQPKERIPVGRSNPYKGSTSLVLRALVEKPRFSTQQELADLARELQPELLCPVLSKGTVAKALTALKEDFVVTVGRGQISLVDLSHALIGLKKNRRSGKRLVWSGNTSLTNDELSERFTQKGVIFMTSPSQAVLIDGLLAGNEVRELMVADLRYAVSVLGKTQNRLFPNLVLVEAQEDSSFFALREHVPFPLPSLLECYLAANEAGGRDAEVAQGYVHMMRKQHSKFK